eukprot:c10046_g1_i4.p1 GENE.c10046_g1_i4~~c10046_g1_i4.p1  ORF type:complete len:418 (+),score=59.12 c10046_g1_i4:24-1256(+)
MPNLGNTCYLNAILQSLFSIPSFVSDIHEAATHCKSETFTSQLSNFAKQTNRRADLIRSIKATIGNRFGRFRGRSQQDAHEFFLSCLSVLEAELSVASASARLLSWDHVICPVTRNFYCEIKHTFVCQTCDSESSVSELYRDILLSFPESGSWNGSYTITQLLDHFFQKSEVERLCDQCQGRHSLGRRKIAVLPRVFVLGIERFRHNRHTSKISTAVQFADSLDLESLCDELCLKTLPHETPQGPQALQSPPLEQKSSQAPLSQSPKRTPVFQTKSSGKGLLGGGTEPKKDATFDMLPSLVFNEPVQIDNAESPIREIEKYVEVNTPTPKQISRSETISLTQDETDTEILTAIQLSKQEQENLLQLQTEEEKQLQQAISESLRDDCVESVSVSSTEDEAVDLQVRISIIW